MTSDNDGKDSKKKPSTSFTVGAIALIFLAIGYQTALFIHRAAVEKIISDRDHPDTVYIYNPVSDEDAQNDGKRLGDHDDNISPAKTYPVRKYAPHSREALSMREKYGQRSYESFPFNPNTASIEELMRLGFSRKQAESIDRYRRAGGRFRKKEDFAKSYVVADSVYERLEPYIDIPLTDLNKADSTALDALPGIGPWYASEIVRYRNRLHGFSYKEQLMDIKGFDEDKFNKLESLVTLSSPAPYRLWSLPEDSLALHPYIGKKAAHGIILFRENNPQQSWTVDKLLKAGILTAENASKLSRCELAE